MLYYSFFYMEFFRDFRVFRGQIIPLKRCLRNKRFKQKRFNHVFTLHNIWCLYFFLVRFLTMKEDFINKREVKVLLKNKCIYSTPCFFIFMERIFRSLNWEAWNEKRGNWFFVFELTNYLFLLNKVFVPLHSVSFPVKNLSYFSLLQVFNRKSPVVSCSSKSL